MLYHDHIDSVATACFSCQRTVESF